MDQPVMSAPVGANGELGEEEMDAINKLLKGGIGL